MFGDDCKTYVSGDDTDYGNRQIQFVIDITFSFLIKKLFII
jgi:hypothetical protein